MQAPTWPVLQGGEEIRSGLLVMWIHPLCVTGGLAHTPPNIHIYIPAECVPEVTALQGGLAEDWSEHHLQRQRAVNMGNCCNAVGNFFNPPQKNTNVRVSLPAVCFVWQIAMIILFGVFIRYDDESDIKKWLALKEKENITSDIENDFYFRYPSK